MSDTSLFLKRNTGLLKTLGELEIDELLEGSSPDAIDNLFESLLEKSNPQYATLVCVGSFNSVRLRPFKTNSKSSSVFDETRKYIPDQYKPIYTLAN